MINITLPDGSTRQVESGTSALDVAMSISEGLARNVLAAEVNGEVWDPQRQITADATLRLLTWNDDKGKNTMWHSSAHLLAEALEALFPGVKFWVGPPIENGFYYDVDFGDQAITDKDFTTIESKMIELAKQKNPFVRSEMSKADAIAYFTEKDDEYKLDFLRDWKTVPSLFTTKAISQICVADHTCHIRGL